MAYYSSTEIREGSFLCSSDVDFFEPQNIVSDLLDNEADLKFFCEENNLKSGNIYRYVFLSMTKCTEVFGTAHPHESRAVTSAEP